MDEERGFLILRSRRKPASRRMNRPGLMVGDGAKKRLLTLRIKN
jgi:hypothetical protein